MLRSRLILSQSKLTISRDVYPLLPNIEPCERAFESTMVLATPALIMADKCEHNLSAWKLPSYLAFCGPPRLHLLRNISRKQSRVLPWPRGDSGVCMAVDGHGKGGRKVFLRHVAQRE